MVYLIMKKLRFTALMRLVMILMVILLKMGMKLRAVIIPKEKDNYKFVKQLFLGLYE